MKTIKILRAEQSRAEQSRAEQSRAEQSRAEVENFGKLSKITKRILIGLVTSLLLMFGSVPAFASSQQSITRSATIDANNYNNNVVESYGNPDTGFTFTQIGSLSAGIVVTSNNPWAYDWLTGGSVEVKVTDDSGTTLYDNTTTLNSSSPYTEVGSNNGALTTYYSIPIPAISDPNGTSTFTYTVTEPTPLQCSTSNTSWEGGATGGVTELATSNSGYTNTNNWSFVYYGAFGTAGITEVDKIAQETLTSANTASTNATNAMNAANSANTAAQAAQTAATNAANGTVKPIE